VQTRATSKPSAGHTSKTFFGSNAARASPFFRGVQAKLTMGAPGDRFEREADSMADGVVQRMQAGEARGRGAPSLQAKCSACQEEDEKLQREPQACESCGEPLQAKSEGSMDVPESVQQTLGAAGGGGAALQPDLREEMESAFAADFGDVRIHTGGTAAKLNHDLHARAFTHGSDIYFNTGEFQPHSQSGRHLLAHELAHVLQQSTPAIQREEKDKGGESDTSCLTGAPAGVGRAEYKDQTKGKSGTYYIYGDPYKGESTGEYTHAAIEKWMRGTLGDPSGPVKDRIRAETSRWGWQWVPHQPQKGCQAQLMMSMDDAARLIKMAGLSIKARKEEKQEKAAGLPDLSPPPAFGTDVELEAPQGGGGGGDSKDARKAAEEALDPTSVYNKGRPGATDPPFPITMDGPEMEVPNGIGTFTARLQYERVTNDPAMLLAYGMNSVTYYWEIFNITDILMRGMAMGSSMVKEAQRTQQLAQNLPQNKQAADAADGALRQHGKNAIDQLSEETRDSLRELRDPVKAAAGGSAIDVVTRAYANYLNLELLPVSIIVAAGGFLVKAFASLLGGYQKEKEIAFPESEGYYMVRCIAQPGPRGPNNSERRAASVRAKIVEVRQPEKLAKNALGLADAAIANLELQKVMTSDPAEIARIDKQIANIQEQQGGDIVAYLKRLIAEKEAAKKNLPQWRQYHAEREIKSLQLRLEQVQDKREGTGGKHIRPQVAFTSTITGDTYPLMIELSPIPLFDDEGVERKDKFEVRLFDATVPDREKIDRKGNTLEEAVENVFEIFRKSGVLGPGLLFVRMPADWKGKREFSLRVSATGGALVKKRLEDLATVLLVMSMVVPGVGEVSMAIAAGLAAERLISRALNHTLRLDFESVADTLAILGAVAQGASLIGKLRVAKSGNAFVAALRTADPVVLTAAADELAKAIKLGKALNATSTIVNVGGLIWGDLVMINRFAEIQAAEMNGTISHAEASRQRASMLANAITTHGVMLHGMMKADLASGDTAKPEPPARENIPPRTEPRVETAQKPVETPQKPVETPRKPVERTQPQEGKPKPVDVAPAKPVEKPDATQKPATTEKQGPPETIPEKELEQRANAPPKTSPDAQPGPQRVAVRSKFRTPDNLHDIYIMEDGRIFRCSLSCTELHGWYDPYLSAQPEGPRRHRASELSGDLAKLEARTKAGEKSPELEQAIGKLDVAMREFIAPDLARELQDSHAGKQGLKPGEKFLTEDQVRALLKFFNVDEIVKFTGEEGLPSAKAVRDLAELIGKMDRVLRPEDRAALRPILDAVVEGGAAAASGIEFLQKVERVRQHPNIVFDMADYVAAFQRGDAILDHGPMQKGEFFADEFGDHTLSEGKLTIEGKERLPKKMQSDWKGEIDFVILQTEGGGIEVILGREHTGLSGEKAWVFGAGRIFVNKAGFVTKIDRKSGHYRPSVENFERAVKTLIDEGFLMDPAAIEEANRNATEGEKRPVMVVDPASL